jgi:predicted nucleotidyltransferase
MNRYIGGLSEYTVKTITSILEKHAGIKTALLFGSRAKGNYREGSDIDISLITEEAFGYHDLIRLSGEFDDSNLPYFFDLNIFSQIKNDELREHINRVGKTLYQR